MTEQGNNRSDECIIETVEQKEKVIEKGTQPIRIRAEQYNALVELSDMSGNKLSDLASDLLCYALKHIKIVKKN